MNTIDILKTLLKHNSAISALHVVPITQSVFVQNAIETAIVDKNQVEAALSIRAQHKFSFWDALCSVFIDNPAYSKTLLSNVFHHNYNNEVLLVGSQDFLNDELRLDKDKSYAATSNVVMKDGRICHIPMVDFHCCVSSTNESLVYDVALELDAGPGFILNSGNSYHFLGTNLIEGDGIYKFMGRMIMFNPIIDKSWVAHQMIEGYCALRITEKNGLMPRVVREIFAADLPNNANL